LVNLNDPVVRGYFINLVGEEGFKVVEKIADVTGVLLNIVRRTLFILYENRLAVYRRVRDTDSGWLTYLWRLDLESLENQLELESKKVLKNLKIKFEFEDGKVFYACNNRCSRFLFETATDLLFICPICGENLEYQDNEPVIKALRQRIDKLEDMTSRATA
jgi:transcription initiation factor TFIIE subunit alpha